MKVGKEVIETDLSSVRISTIISDFGLATSRKQAQHAVNYSDSRRHKVITKRIASSFPCCDDMHLIFLVRLIFTYEPNAPPKNALIQSQRTMKSCTTGPCIGMLLINLARRPAVEIFYFYPN